jgi:hypothetical protein
MGLNNSGREGTPLKTARVKAAAVSTIGSTSTRSTRSTSKRPSSIRNNIVGVGAKSAN